MGSAISNCGFGGVSNCPLVELLEDASFLKRLLAAAGSEEQMELPHYSHITCPPSSLPCFCIQERRIPSVRSDQRQAGFLNIENGWMLTRVRGYTCNVDCRSN